MRDENGVEIKGLAHVEREVHFAGGPSLGTRDLAVAFIGPYPPPNLDLCKVLVGPTAASSREGDLCATLTLEQAQRVGVAILRAASTARGGGVEVGAGRLLSDIELAAREMEGLQRERDEAVEQVQALKVVARRVVEAHQVEALTEQVAEGGIWVDKPTGEFICGGCGGYFDSATPPDEEHEKPCVRLEALAALGGTHA